MALKSGNLTGFEEVAGDDDDNADGSTELEVEVALGVEEDD